MKKTPILILAATFLIIISGVFLFGRGSTNKPSSTPLPAPTSYLYFWGNGCSHCANVEKFLESWAGKDKIKIDKKEVWYNTTNAKEMTQRGVTCGYSQQDLAVPFLVTPEGKCFMGDESIINFFKELTI